MYAAVVLLLRRIYPKPHQGQEYGDLSITIHIGNAAHNLQGIMKSQTTKITRSSNTGREILTKP